MSIDLQKSVIADQAVVTGITEDAEFDYMDNDSNHVEPTAEELVQQAKEKKQALKEKNKDNSEQGTLGMA